MQTYSLFTDGSVNNQTKIGVGGYLLFDGVPCKTSSLAKTIHTKKFNHTSSTKLELQTLLWALEQLTEEKTCAPISVTVYTDSQNIVGLPSRRSALEDKNYLTAKHKLLNNHELYKQFFHLADTHVLQLVKLKGHKPTIQRTLLDDIFNLVDQHVRHQLRHLTCLSFDGKHVTHSGESTEQAPS